MCARTPMGTVTVVDAAPGPATTSRALGLQPRGAEVLNRMGALANLPDRSLAGWNLVVVADGETLIHSHGRPAGQP